MIAYRDFIAWEGSFGTKLTIDEVVKLANEWLTANPVDLITIETIMFSDAGVLNRLRIWYRVAA